MIDWNRAMPEQWGDVPALSAQTEEPVEGQDEQLASSAAFSRASTIIPEHPGRPTQLDRSGFNGAVAREILFVK